MKWIIKVCMDDPEYQDSLRIAWKRFKGTADEVQAEVSRIKKDLEEWKTANRMTFLHSKVIARKEQT